MKMPCPHCHETLEVSPAAWVPNEQTLKVSLASESEFIAADTIGEVIRHTSKLMRAVASQMGVKTVVFLKDIGLSSGKCEIEFLIARAKEQSEVTEEPKDAT